MRRTPTEENPEPGKNMRRSLSTPPQYPSSHQCPCGQKFSTQKLPPWKMTRGPTPVSAGWTVRLIVPVSRNSDGVGAKALFSRSRGVCFCHNVAEKGIPPHRPNPRRGYDRRRGLAELQKSQSRVSRVLPSVCLALLPFSFRINPNDHSRLPFLRRSLGLGSPGRTGMKRCFRKWGKRCFVLGGY